MEKKVERNGVKVMNHMKDTKEVKEIKETQPQVQVQLTWEDLPLSNFELHWESQFLGVSLEDWLALLCSQNDKAKSWHDTREIDLRELRLLGEGNLSHSSVSHIVYNWCQQLKQPDGVSYRTVELYQHFVRSYYCQRFCMITPPHQTQETVPTTKKDPYQDIITEIRQKSLLRLVSCLQIASKLDGYKVVEVTDAIRLLQQSKRPSHRSAVVDSEVLVLVALKHNVNFPPIIDFLDTLMCQLIKQFKNRQATAKTKELLLKVDEIYENSKDFIRVIYFEQEVFIDQIVAALRLDKEAQKVRSGKRVRDFHGVQSDKVLLAAAAITAAIYVIQSNAVSDVLRLLYKRAGAHPSEVAVVSSLLVSHQDPMV